MNVFNQFKTINNLDAAQLDEVINQAFNKLTEKYDQFNISYDEDGVSILNLKECTDEEISWIKDEAESNLTNELLKIANQLAQK